MSIFRDHHSELITSAEKILFIHHRVDRAKFGEEPEHYGIDEMIREGIITDALPLHDSDAHPTWLSPLSDRQVSITTSTKNLFFISWFSGGALGKKRVLYLGIGQNNNTSIWMILFLRCRIYKITIEPLPVQNLLSLFI